MEIIEAIPAPADPGAILIELVLMVAALVDLDPPRADPRPEMGLGIGHRPGQLHRPDHLLRRRPQGRIPITRFRRGFKVE